MLRNRPGLLLLIFAAGCPPPAAAPVLDAGTDAGSCTPPCTPPPTQLCPDLDGGACSDSVLCCPGLLCSSGRCVTPPNPCPNGERLRASGCACDPMAADSGCFCDAGPGASCEAACFADLHCHPVPIPTQCGVTTCTNVKPICLVPALNLCGCSTANGDSCNLVGLVCDQIPPAPNCRLPLVGEPCVPNRLADGGGCQPQSTPPLECDSDPSGAHLYVCTAICSSNADCPNGWQYCTIPDGGSSGRCADNACDHPYTPCSLHLPGGSSAAQGLCLPFGVLQTNPDGTKQAVTSGLCLEASLQTGATGVPCDRLFRRGPDAGPDAGASTDGGPGSFCNLVSVCTPLGTCAPACDLADGGVCMSGGLHCKTINPRPFATARDPDSGVLEGSGACQ